MIVGIAWSSGYGIVIATASGVATIGAATAVLIGTVRWLKRAASRRRHENQAPPSAHLVTPLDRNDETSGADPLELLRQQYAAGRQLQEALIWTINASSDVRTQARDREQSRDRACAWAKETWQILDRHFPAYEAEFYGEHRPLGPSYFAIACAEQVKKLGGNEHSYLEAKLEFLGTLLRTLDAPPRYTSRSQRTVEKCLADALTLRAVISTTTDWSRADDVRHQVADWAEDTSAALRRDVSRYSNWFTRIRIASDSRDALARYLDMRIEELHRIIRQLGR